MPPIRLSRLDPDLRSGRDEDKDTGREIITINTDHFMYKGLQGDDLYVAETAVLEFLRPYDDEKEQSERITAEEYYRTASQVLNAWWCVVREEGND